MLRLYAFFTQNSMKPLYVLEELGIDFDLVYVDLFKREAATEEFRVKNPMRKVPVLEHNGRYLFESSAICRYVANISDSPLYPQEKMERAQVDQWIDYFTCHLGRWLTTLFFELIIKPKAGMGDPSEAACAEATKFAHQGAGIVDELLGESQWLANDQFSIADLYALAYVEQYLSIDFPLDQYANLKAWFDRLGALESVTRARAWSGARLAELNA